MQATNESGWKITKTAGGDAGISGDPSKIYIGVPTDNITEAEPSLTQYLDKGDGKFEASATAGGVAEFSFFLHNENLTRAKAPTELTVTVTGSHPKVFVDANDDGIEDENELHDAVCWSLVYDGALVGHSAYTKGSLSAGVLAQAPVSASPVSSLPTIQGNDDSLEYKLYVWVDGAYVNEANYAAVEATITVHVG